MRIITSQTFEYFIKINIATKKIIKKITGIQNKNIIKYSNLTNVPFKDTTEEK